MKEHIMVEEKCTAAKDSFLEIGADCWQCPVQYVHVLHCHSNPVPVEESHIQCHEPLSCVLMSAPSGPHCAQLS